VRLKNAGPRSHRHPKTPRVPPAQSWRSGWYRGRRYRQIDVRSSWCAPAVSHGPGTYRGGGQRGGENSGGTPVSYAAPASRMWRARVLSDLYHGMRGSARRGTAATQENRTAVPQGRNGHCDGARRDGIRGVVPGCRRDGGRRRSILEKPPGLHPLGAPGGPPGLGTGRRCATSFTATCPPPQWPQGMADSGRMVTRHRHARSSIARCPTTLRFDGNGSPGCCWTRRDEPPTLLPPTGVRRADAAPGCQCGGAVGISAVRP